MNWGPHSAADGPAPDDGAALSAEAPQGPTPFGSAGKVQAARASRQRPGWGRTFASLSNPGFRNLWTGMMFATGGSHIMLIARSFLVYELTGSAKILGIVGAGVTIPALALALIGGAVADRVDRKTMVQLYNWSLTAIALFVAVTIATHTLTWVHLLVAALIQGAAFSFYSPARQSLIPQLVGREQLGNALAMNGAQLSAMSLVGPAVGGVLYAAIGPEGAHYVVAAIGLVAILFTRLIPRPPLRSGRERSPMLVEIGAGLSYIKRNPLVTVLLGMATATILLVGPFTMLMPVIVVDVYKRESAAYGLLVGLTGFGSLAGALVIASIGNWRRGMMLIGGGFAAGLALLLVALFPIYQAALAFMMILGLGDAARRTLNTALILEKIEDRFRGRVISLYTLATGLLPLGLIPAGIAIDSFGSQTTVGILAVGMLTASTLVLVTQKKLRNLN